MTGRLLRFAVGAALLSSAHVATSGPAHVHAVDDVLIVTDADPNGPNGFLTLLAAANDDPEDDHDTIVIGPGIAFMTLAGPGASFEVTEDLTIVGPDDNEFFIWTEGGPATFDVSGVETDFVLDGLTIGSAPGEGGSPGGVGVLTTGPVRSIELTGVDIVAPTGRAVDATVGTSATLGEVTVTQSGTDGIRLVSDDPGSGTVDLARVSVSEANGVGIRVDGFAQAAASDLVVDGTTSTSAEILNTTSVGLDRVTLTDADETPLVVGPNVAATDVVHATIADNASAADHLIRFRDGTVTLRHSTIAGNTMTGVDQTAVLVDDAVVTVHHSVVTENGTADAFDVAGTGSVAGDRNVVPVGQAVGADDVETDGPLALSPLADNGGFTPTRRPLGDSNIVDRGDPDIADAPDFDQRLGDRIVGAAIDIGAVEYDPGTLAVFDATVREGDGIAEVEIARTGSIGDGAVEVRLQSGVGSATPGVDFTPVDTTITFADQATGIELVSIPILTDELIEGTETFPVTITTTNTDVEVVEGEAVVTILDDAPQAITSLTPARFADTRDRGVTVDGQFARMGKLPAGGQLEVRIAGRGAVPAGAVGVVMNVTAVNPEGTGYVTVHPCLTPRPLASSLNYTPGVNLGNEVVAKLDAQGDVCLYTFAPAHVTVDVVGYVSPTSKLKNLDPARILDTREVGAAMRTIDGRFEGEGKPGAGQTVELEVGGRAGVPADAAAVMINVTAVQTDQTGFVTVHPCLPTPPLASSLNYVVGVNRGNELIAQLDDDGNICLFTSTNIHLTADVMGYLPAGTNIMQIDPARYLDTRPTGLTFDRADQKTGKQPEKTEYRVQVAGRGDVPALARAAIVNVTAVQPDAKGFLTVHPCQVNVPLASSLNYVPFVNGGNEIVARLSDTGELCVYTDQRTHLTVDVVGYLV